MRCYPEDDPDDLAERRASRFVTLICGALAVGYLLTLFVWRVCA
jgi:hypothetical protein